MGNFINNDWKSMYGDVKEMIPSDFPVPRGKEVELCLFVDSDHVGEQFTRRSRNGFVIYLSMAPIVWFSKHHPTVESSVFGAEFEAMYNGIETCSGLRYKLRMVSVTLSYPIPMLWGQYVCLSQHPSARLCLEEEVKLYLPSCSTLV
jgi:hypothetical protein